MKITKRDKTVVDFDKSKVKIAVTKAFIDVDGEETPFAKEKAREIANYIESLNRDMTVEEVQDAVVAKLMAGSRKDVAMRYVEYRHTRKLARDQYRELMDAVAEKLSAANVVNQNANVDEYSFGGRIGEASEAVNKKFALDYIVSEMARDNHLSNEIYIHDLGAYAVGEHNCLSVPFDDLLATGFNTRQTDVRPAQSINTAFQLVAVIFQIQSLQQFGGVSATHLDHTMVPYVRKSFRKHYLDGMKYILGVEEDIEDGLSIEDPKYKPDTAIYRYAMDLTKRELKQAAEGLYHNLK